MTNHTNRLNKLEREIRPSAHTVYRFSSVIDYDELGQCAGVVVYGADDKTLLDSFTAQPGESREALCARAYAAVGRQPNDGVIEHHIIQSGPNGGPAPGFEWLAHQSRASATS